MQEIGISNPPLVIGICDPNKSLARHRHSLKLCSKLKYLNKVQKNIYHQFCNYSFCQMLACYFKNPFSCPPRFCLHSPIRPPQPGKIGPNFDSQIFLDVSCGSCSNKVIESGVFFKFSFKNLFSQLENQKKAIKHLQNENWVLKCAKMKVIFHSYLVYYLNYVNQFLMDLMDLNLLYLMHHLNLTSTRLTSFQIWGNVANLHFFPFSSLHNYPTDIYLLKATTETLEKDVRYVRHQQQLTLFWCLRC